MDTSPPPSGVPEPWARPDNPLLTVGRVAARKVLPDTLRYELYWRLLNTPVAAELYTLGRGRLRHRRIQPTTRVVIEGFPSSGNTYARQAFLLANPTVSIDDVCSHTHVARVVVKGVRAGVPCIVLAREPKEAVASTVQRFHDPLANCFDHYTRYYRRLLPLRDQFIVAPFPTAMANFRGVLKLCDERYGVDFLSDPTTDLSTEAVFASIEERARWRHGGKTNEAGISRPSSSRMKADEFLSDLSDKAQRACAEATESYHEFIAGAPTPPD